MTRRADVQGRRQPRASKASEKPPVFRGGAAGEGASSYEYVTMVPNLRQLCSTWTSHGPGRPRSTPRVAHGPDHRGVQKCRSMCRANIYVGSTARPRSRSPEKPVTI